MSSEMDIFLKIFLAVLVYILGMALVIRFAAFMHHCDDDVRSMIRKPKNNSRRSRRLKKQRPRYQPA